MNIGKSIAARWVQLLVILLSGGISVWWGYSIALTVPGGPLDFQAVYYGAKCLIQHNNPYNVAELETLYRSEGGVHAADSLQRRQTVTLFVNLPPTLLLVAPFTMLPIGVAQSLWGLLAAAGLLGAGFLVWELGARYSLVVSGFLIAFFLANCELVFLTGNTVGLVISLCVVAVWCFVEERFVPLGIICMGFSLAIKPHDVGFVWLYFLLAGGVYRKRVLQSLAITCALGFAALAWVSAVAPHWFRDWSSNMTVISAPGGLNSPGPLSMTINILGSVISLQTLFALLHDGPAFYNSLTYAICGAMLIIWAVRTVKIGFSSVQVWLALAAVTPITMIVTYHRSYDAKLLILTIPACVMLLKSGAMVGKFALALNLGVLFLTADFPLTILTIWARDMQIPAAGIFRQIGTILLMRPAPLALLLMSVFYLWVYIRGIESVVSNASEEPVATAAALRVGEGI